MENVVKCLKELFDCFNALETYGDNILGNKGLMNTLLPKSFCSLEHCTSKLTLLLNTLTYWHTLLLSTLCSQEHFAPWNTSSEQSMLRRTICQGGKCSREQSVQGSRVFQKGKCAEKQSVLWSKVFWGAKCSSANKVPKKHRNQQIYLATLIWIGDLEQTILLTNYLLLSLQNLLNCDVI